MESNYTTITALLQVWSLLPSIHGVINAPNLPIWEFLIIIIIIIIIKKNTKVKKVIIFAIFYPINVINVT